MPAIESTASNITRSCAYSLAPSMLRDLDGNIRYWNRAAEKNYGIPERSAVGSVSHLLLDTVFPQPLEEINHQLMKTGRWNGELIHTLQGGQRVKVRSSWELVAPDATCVVETNSNFVELRPQFAHLVKRASLLERSLRFLAEFRIWWLLPLLLTLLAADLLVELTPVTPVLPLRG